MQKLLITTIMVLSVLTQQHAMAQLVDLSKDWAQCKQTINHYANGLIYNHLCASDNGQWAKIDEQMLENLSQQSNEICEPFKSGTYADMSVNQYETQLFEKIMGLGALIKQDPSKKDDYCQVASKKLNELLLSNK